MHKRKLAILSGNANFKRSAAQVAGQIKHCQIAALQTPMVVLDLSYVASFMMGTAKELIDTKYGLEPGVLMHISWYISPMHPSCLQELTNPKSAKPREGPAAALLPLVLSAAFVLPAS
jgi:hypothetical protein